MDDPRPGTRAHFDKLNREIRDLYWSKDLAYLGLSLATMGEDNARSVLNRKQHEARRFTPPTASEATAIEATVWDNWHATGGKRPKEGEENHDKARFKLSIELWDKPTGVPIFGKGPGRAPNSIYQGTAILMDQAALATYTKDKRAGKKIATPWAPGTPLGTFADDLDYISQSLPDALVGPLCWTSNKKAFVPDMLAVVMDVGIKGMRARVMIPGGSFDFTRWTTKRCDNSPIPIGAQQCRATSRPDQSAWRNAKLIANV